MSAFTLSPVTYGTVTGVFGGAGPDGPDGDVAPDAYVATGTFTFTPTVPYLISTNPSQRIDILSMPGTIDGTGNLSNSGSAGVELVATDGALAKAAGLQYTVTCPDYAVNGVKQTFTPVTINVPGGTTTDLLSAVPVLKATLVTPVGLQINDTAASLTTVYSSMKTNAVITALISDTATDAVHTWSAERILAALDAAGSGTATAATTALRGPNEAGYDFVNTTTPGTDNTTMPSNASILYAALQGATMIRLPWLWDYLQPTPLGAFASAFQSKLVATVKYARSLGLVVVFDNHSYARKLDASGVQRTLGDGVFLLSWIVDCWTRLCAVDGIGNDPGVHFGLMNEPHDLPSQAGTISGSEFYTNPGFETDLTGYTALNSATIARTTAQFHSGVASVAVTAGSNNEPQLQAPTVTIDPTKHYQLSYWTKAATTPRQVFCVISFSGASGYISTVTANASFVTNSTTAWTEVIVNADIVIPAGATTAVAGLIVNRAAAGEVHWVDDLSWKVSTAALSGAQVWEQAVQALITAIRATGSVNRIYWSGYNFSAAATFWAQHPTFIPVDPLNNSVPEAHYYADGAGSGTLSYAQTVSYAQGKGAVATSKMDALQVNTYKDLTSFLDGARNRGLEAYIGEIGAFSSTAPIVAAGNTVAVNELQLWAAWLEGCYEIFDSRGTAVTYWSAGDEFDSFNYAYDIYTGVPNSGKTTISAVVEAHYSEAGALNAARLAA